jgi:hypothetical protein
LVDVPGGEVHKAIDVGGAMQWGAALAALLACGGAARTKAPEYPLYCAGIVVGMSTDRDVRRMYGTGLYVRDEGHGGGRYFVDSGRRVTLHVELGPDDTIDEVSYGRGLQLPARYLKSRRVPSRAISPQLTTNEHLYLGIRLGEKATDVLGEFGKPRSDTRHGLTRVVRYEADYEQMPYVLDYEAEFRFENNRLVAVKLYNGE